MAKNEALEKVKKMEELERANQLPDFMKDVEVDESQLNPDDLRLPRLAIAQAMSPQMTPGKSEFMEDLKLYDLFNDLTQVIYDTPVKFIPIQRDVARIEFDETGTIVLDRNVPYDDPRNDWTKHPETGVGIAPRASKFVNFISLLLHEDSLPEPIVISIRQSNKFARKAAERLTSFIEMKKQMRRIPTYGGIYEVSVKPETFPKGTAGVFVFTQAGLVQDKSLFEAAKRFSDSLKGKNLVINHERPTETAGADEDTSFDTDKMDREASAGSTEGM